MSQRRWIFKPAPAGAIDLGSALGVVPEVAAILLQRGLGEAAEARRFLEPRLADLRDPYLIKGMDRAVARIERALKAGERIVLFADYDVDGVSAAAILIELLGSLGLEAACVIPDRLSEGYGLSEHALDRVAALRPSLLITLDSGVSDAPRIARAAKAGIETIVVDHHELPGEPPPAVAIIDPKQAGCRFPFKGMAAVGLAFYLACAVRTRLGSRLGLPSRQDWLDLVALGTIADLAPLREENRILVKAGLARLTGTARPGLVALKEVSGLGGAVGSADVAFRLAPRLNAAGRMGDAMRAVRLLVTAHRSEATQLAAELDQDNARRQAVEAEIEEECLRLLAGSRPDHSVMVHSEGWHPGVIGIVASRLAERFWRPAIVLAEENGLWRGSARAIKGLHLFEALCACAHLLERFGGHQQAGGMVVSDENLPAFRAAFEAFCASRLSEADLIPAVELDLAVPLENVSLRLAEELGLLEPYGVGNPRPLFAAHRVRPLAWSCMGERHLRASFSCGGGRLEAVGFGLWAEAPSGPLDIAFGPELNDWQGLRSVRLNIKAIRPAGAAREP